MNDLRLMELRAGFDRLRGRLFEVFEATGMPVRQEEAAKRVVRRITYDSQRAIEGALHDRQAHRSANSGTSSSSTDGSTGTARSGAAL
jgi:hypothetical protein